MFFVLAVNNRIYGFRPYHNPQRHCIGRAADALVDSSYQFNENLPSD